MKKLLFLLLFIPCILLSEDMSYDKTGVFYSSIGYKDFGDHGSYLSGIGIRAWIVGMGVDFAPTRIGGFKTIYISGFIPYKWFALHGSIGQTSVDQYTLELRGIPATMYALGFQVYVSNLFVIGYQYRFEKTYNFNILNLGVRF